MKYLAIHAEGPSSDIMNRRENPTGHTYLAPHEPARFVPFDPEITARAMRNAFMLEPVESHRPSLLRTIQELRTQLETARKALEGLQWNADPIIRAHVMKALAQIGAGQKGGK